MTSWRQIEEGYENLAKREKIMMIATIVVVMFVGVQGLFVDPLEAEIKELREEETVLIDQMSTLNITLVEKQLQVETDIDEPTRIAITELESELARIAGQLDDKIADLIEPSVMKKVLLEILDAQSKLRLTGLKNVPVKSIEDILKERNETNIVEDVLSDDDSALLFRHGLEFSFTGSFVALVEFMKKMEALNWNFYWSELQFKTVVYPHSEIKMKIFTLSNDEEVIAI